MNIDRLNKIEYETNLKVFFAKIYLALMNLKDKGYVYTDLKPQNIIIGPKNEPYLIDLESVVKLNNKRVCIYTDYFFPQELKGILKFRINFNHIPIF